MNKIDFTQTGGFPFDQSILDFLQNSIELVSQITAIAPPRAILSGVTVTGDTASDGVVCIDGEILPFVGGTIQPKIVIIQVVSDLTYFDDSTGISEDKPVVTTRHATFGDDGVTNYLWLDFDRVLPAWLPGDVKEIDCTLAYFNANFDSTGLGINEREGWAYCNGQNETKDRRGRVSVQYDVTQGEFNIIGKTGGEKVHTLTIEEMPSHSHGQGADVYYTTGGGTSHAAGDSGAGTRGNTTSTGGGGAHNNLQDYIVTVMIQKVKKQA